MGFFKKLTRELFNLNVSQFLAFIFFAAPLFVEIIKLWFDKETKYSIYSNTNLYQDHWKYIILFSIVLPNGLRIFLASWETEDDPMHRKIVELLKVKRKMQVEWGLRFLWLLSVYLLPFIVQTNNSKVIERNMMIYWLALFFLLIVWDVWTNKLINNNRSWLKSESDKLKIKLGNNEIVDEDYFEISETKPEIPFNYHKKNFDIKVKLWLTIDVIIASALLLFYVSIFYLNSSNNPIQLAMVYGIMGTIIIIFFSFEFFLNARDYGYRFFWCLLISFLVAFVLFYIGEIPKDKVSLEPYKKELLQTDSFFAHASELNGSNAAFIEYVDSNATLFSNYNIPLDGRNFIINYLSVHTDSVFKLTWKPIYSDIASSCDLGYTCGIYELKTKDTIITGTYCTAWKKDKNNKWKFVLKDRIDIRN